ncbi:glutathione S-transferase family protein [Ponticaulis profundi]|uniref:Glutathione S-transferase family protein n=1 Tax=Ponticaulis profundi TaxID=2665222 RepID=A0ABW1S9V7_9PROT
MITIHHLQNSRSMRLLWLMEELGLDYEVKVYARDPETNLAPEDYKALHPLGKSPIVTDGDNVLAETGAIVEYFMDRYPNAGMRPDLHDPARARYHYWMHAAEGSYMPPLVMGLFFSRMETQPPFFLRPIIKAVTGRVRDLYLSPTTKALFEYANEQLGYSDWITGPYLTGADIMMSYPLEAASARLGLGDAYPNIAAYVARIHARPGYQRAVEKGGEPEILK